MRRNRGVMKKGTDSLFRLRRLSGDQRIHLTQDKHREESRRGTHECVRHIPGEQKHEAK